MSRILERLLVFASRPERGGDRPSGEVHWTPASALDKLRREFPGFDSIVAGKRVCDYGCGAGFQSIALAALGCEVVGVDTSPTLLQVARNLQSEAAIPEARLTFLREPPDGGFDIVISQNSFEHFPAPDETLRHMQALLAPQGLLLITFGPPWLAPYGSHMHFFTRIPWLNVLFPERVVMRVRQRYRADGARRYEEVEGGLNRMTIRRFESLVASSGLQVIFRKYTGVRGLDWTCRVPGLREFFTNNVSMALKAQFDAQPANLLKG
jgi:SAM-dependent methyltransferase